MISKNPRTTKKKPNKTGNRPRYSMEEFARRGEEIFQRDIKPKLKGADKHDFVLIDIETGAFEVDSNEMAASDRLAARVPNAQVWMRCVGSRYARHYGGWRETE